MHTQADFPIGVAVTADNSSNSFLNSNQKQAVIGQQFSQITAGNIMKMSYLHPAENTYSWSQADTMIAWADSNGIEVHGHTLIWHSDYQVPDWMKSYTGDWQAMLDKHVSDIVAHFGADVVSWDVVNEAFEGSGYRNSIFYQQLGAAYIENAFVAARAADADVDLYYNDYSLVDNGAKFGHVLDMAEDFQGRGVPLSGIGFQMHIQRDSPSISNIRAAFKAVADLGLKVKITELDIPLNNPYVSDDSFPQYSVFSAEAAEVQKQRYKAVVQAYLDEVPAAQRGGITVWGLVDSESWLLSFFDVRNGVDDWPLLFSGPSGGPYTAKPALEGFEEALRGE